MIDLSSMDSLDSIDKVLGGNDQYEVPLYQRRYVWAKPNWKALWDDILGQVEIPPAKRGTGHFTGPIVTRRIDGEQASSLSSLNLRV